MNKTEALAYDWLRQRYLAEDIAFRSRESPDFITSDGQGWEVKLVRQHSVIFSCGQVEKLRAHGRVQLLLYKEDDGELLEVPFSEIEVPGYWRNIRFNSVRMTPGLVDMNIRGVAPELWKALRKAAIDRGVALGVLLNQIVREWLERQKEQP